MVISQLVKETVGLVVGRRHRSCHYTHEEAHREPSSAKHRDVL